MATARVLVVDDEPGVLELAARILRGAGYEVMPAPSAEEALKTLDSAQPVDLVLSDVVMPGMRGPELLDEVKRRSPGTRLMLMSAYPAGETLPDVAFVSKPFVPKQLLAAVERTVSKSAQARQELARAVEQSREAREEARRVLEETRQVERDAREARRRAQERRRGE